MSADELLEVCTVSLRLIDMALLANMGDHPWPANRDLLCGLATALNAFLVTQGGIMDEGTRSSKRRRSTSPCCDSDNNDAGNGGRPRGRGRDLVHKASLAGVVVFAGEGKEVDKISASDVAAFVTRFAGRSPVVLQVPPSSLHSPSLPVPCVCAFSRPTRRPG